MCVCVCGQIHLLVCGWIHASVRCVWADTSVRVCVWGGGADTSEIIL